MLRKHGFWLAVQGLLLTLVLAAVGRLEPLESGDSETFRGHAAVSFLEFLTQRRAEVPYGYPLFLRWVGLISPSPALVPLCQFLLHGVAVYLFYRGLRCLLGLPGFALMAASTLLYSNTFLEYGRRVMSDAPASSLAIFTSAMVFFLARDPRRPAAWLGLAFGTLATPQFRGAYLFLLLLIPVVGLLLMRVSLPPADWARYRVRAGLGLLAACLLPTLGYSWTCRLLAGHDSNATMASGRLLLVAAPFMTEEVFDRLPPEAHALGQIVLHRQKHLEEGRLPPEIVEGYRGNFPNLTGEPDLAALRRPKFVVQGADYDPEAVHTLQDLIDLLATAEPEPGFLVWLRETARELKDLSSRHLVLQLVYADLWLGGHEHSNQSGTLAVAVFKTRPRECLHYLGKLFLFGLLGTAVNSYVQGVLLTGFLALVLVWLGRFLLYGAAAPSPIPPTPGDAVQALQVLLIWGLAFAVGKTLLVTLVSIPVPRYLDAAGVFLPGGTLAALALFARYVLFR